MVPFVSKSDKDASLSCCRVLLISMNTLNVRSSGNYCISSEFVRDRRLTHQARFLFVVLRSFASPSSAEPFPSVEELGVICGWNKATVAKYLNELARTGHVQKSQPSLEGRFGLNHYLLDESPEMPMIVRPPAS